jgi:cupin fold WbuC family metalloprotein
MNIVDAARLTELRQAAEAGPRRRSHLNLHDDLSDPIQRVVIALEADTYVRPHRHAEPKWELFALLEGACTVVTFDAEGTVTDRVDLSPTGARLVQIPVGVWHSVVALTGGTLVLEVKPGPYVAVTDKDFAAWAPAEGEAGADSLCRWMQEVAAAGTRWLTSQ